MNDTRQTCQKTVWMYWENPPGFSKPAYLDLCLETIQKHLGSFELKLLDECSVTDYIALPKTIRHPALPLDRKADYIRYALLYEYGGVWFDCDLILLRDVDALVTPGLEQSGFVLFAEIGGGGAAVFIIPACWLRLAATPLSKMRCRRCAARRVAQAWRVCSRGSNT